MTDKPVSRINQIAYMVPDLKAAIDWWTQIMEVGPFFIFPSFDVVKGDYRGQDHVAEFGAAVAYSGDLMVELIEPRGPSIFQEFLADGKKGIHHLCVFADDMAQTERWITAKGGTRLQGAEFADGSQVAYFAMDADEATILEVAMLKPEVKGLFALIQQASMDWDGVSPIFNPFPE
ncbi:MAG: VOC family protein [Sphingobium sp.]